MAAYPISVLGFGDNVVDKYEHIKTMYPGGNAVNFAVFAKKLGVDRSAYMGIFGSDEEAEHVIASLEDEGVELLRCQQVLGVNGAARVTVDETGDRIFLGSNEGGIRGDMRYVIDRFAAEYVSGFDLVHSGNYCFTERELPKIKAAGVPISFDFSDDSTDEYFEQIAPFVTYAFMSMGDASLEDIKAKLEWVKALGPQIVCASRGSKGSVAYDGENFYEQGIKPVAPEELKDAMAAGDSLLTAFLVTYLPRRRPASAARPQFARAWTSLPVLQRRPARSRAVGATRWSTRTSFLSWRGVLGRPALRWESRCPFVPARQDFAVPMSTRIWIPWVASKGASQERFEGCFLSI